MKARPSILVVGAGYVGLATAVFFAKQGYGVTVVEKNRATVDLLKRRRIHFREPKLAAYLKEVVTSGKLVPALPHKEPYETSDIIFIAIDSADPKTGRMKMAPFEQIAAWIGGVKRKTPPTVVLKSTNVLGFAERFRALLDATEHGGEAKLVVNPEFLREGLAYEDTAAPWRIVVGSRDKKHGARLLMVYRTIYPKSVPIVHTDWKSAELIKLGSNVYLAHRLAFVHEIADFARRENLDIASIRQGLSLDPRIGHDYFQPGLGFGGSCLPKDCVLINSTEAKVKFEFTAATAALEVNDHVLNNLVDMLKEQLGQLKGRKIAVFGAAFKGDIDDTRGSRSVALVQKLKRRGANVALYEPLLGRADHTDEGRLPLERDPIKALRNASALIIGTPHRRFALLKPSEVASLVKRKLVIDYFRVLNRKGWRDAGFEII